MASEDADVLKQGARRLARKRMTDGGEVVQGALAQEALDAVGARAMTLDHTIIVGDDFDPHTPEDQALYAHEQVHLQGSGGSHAHHGDHDAEEQAARATERMVLHQARQADTHQAHGEDPTPPPAGAPHASAHPDDPMGAYRSLRAQGMTHDAVVRMLAQDVVQAWLHAQDERRTRGGDR